MSSSLAAFWDKGRRLPGPGNRRPRPVGEPGFELATEHRVWAAVVDARVLAAVDWDAYEPRLGLPAEWQPSPLACEAFGGVFTSSQISPVADGPLPGDRVVAIRRHDLAVVGAWLVTGFAVTAQGSCTLGVRPIVSCLEPVPLRASAETDDDLAVWLNDLGSGLGSDLGARRASPGALLEVLDGPGLVGILRTVGLAPAILCGPADELADCALTNNPPDQRRRRSAARVQLDDSESSRLERRATAEAVDWLMHEFAPGADTRVESSGSGSAVGQCLVARSSDAVVEAIAVGSAATDIEDLELCPTLVHEALDAVDAGRCWMAIVTLDALGQGRTIGLDALAVALCFDAESGRLLTGG